MLIWASNIQYRRKYSPCQEFGARSGAWRPSVTPEFWRAAIGARKDAAVLIAVAAVIANTNAGPVPHRICS